MSVNSAPKDLRTKAYVLHRTNFGEADRILNFITSEGKISCIAKGVRREKSKLAGSIEMFSLIDINIHQGKGNLGVLTSAKMLKFYDSLMTDFSIMSLATTILQKINQAAEHSDNPYFFNLVDQTLSGLNNKINPKLVETWFWFNFAKNCGEEINLYFDNTGAKLNPDTIYTWDSAELNLKIDPNGSINADAIKLMRLIITSNLTVVAQVQNCQSYLDDILFIAKTLNKL